MFNPTHYWESAWMHKERPVALLIDFPGWLLDPTTSQTQTSGISPSQMQGLGTVLPYPHKNHLPLPTWSAQPLGISSSWHPIECQSFGKPVYNPHLQSLLHSRVEIPRQFKGFCPSEAAKLQQTPTRSCIPHQKKAISVTQGAEVPKLEHLLEPALRASQMAGNSPGKEKDRSAANRQHILKWPPEILDKWAINKKKAQMRSSGLRRLLSCHLELPRVLIRGQPSPENSSQSCLETSLDVHLQ
ncbi:uncharacterized protein LOC119928893 [Tachyglossus aculeatus]|uniref:uncharacterized protein LOC119928893 n=1 Tax=Tachyglossus aculeatus TaxID=9261 RepID=UPI0018F5C9E6|nr:uncharacterized protein LOC119928893 [Tachyglossus aculeatus]XP_038603331.1 uncharacterized protein LOC119928893 [Tachyglossus aculeatus]